MFGNVLKHCLECLIDFSIGRSDQISEHRHGYDFPLFKLDISFMSLRTNN